MMTSSVFSTLGGVSWIDDPILSNFILFQGGFSNSGDFGLNRLKKLKMEDCLVGVLSLWELSLLSSIWSTLGTSSFLISSVSILFLCNWVFWSVLRSFPYLASDSSDSSTEAFLCVRQCSLNSALERSTSQWSWGQGIFLRLFFSTVGSGLWSLTGLGMSKAGTPSTLKLTSTGSLGSLRFLCRSTFIW